MIRFRFGFTAVFILFALSTVAAPARAALTADQVTAELLKARDDSRKALDDGLAALKTKTKDKFGEIKDKLAETWKKDLGDTVSTVGSKLDAHRLKIVEGLAGDPARLDRVSTKVTAQFADLTKKLGDLKDTVGDRLQGFDPKADGAAKLAGEKLDALAKEMTAVLGDANWSGAITAVQGAHAAPTADEQVKAAAESVQKFVDLVERDFAKTVKCNYVAVTNNLVCDKALGVSGAEISSIEVGGLPTDKDVVLTASAASESDGENNAPDDPASDTFCLPAGHTGRAEIDVYLYRWVSPTYGAALVKGARKRGDGDQETGNKASELSRAAAGLRESREEDSNILCDGKQWQPRKVPHLALVVSGEAPSILVQVEIANGPGTATPLEIGYARWGVDMGGFFAVVPLADEQIVTEPVAGSSGSMVTIKSIDGKHDYSQDTGIFLNLVPKNYPFIGIGIGFSATEDQANSFYLGGSLRLLSFRNRGVASFSLGATMQSVKRFPGLAEGVAVSATDLRLQGKEQFKFAPYAILQLGFSFGRVPGTENGK